MVDYAWIADDPAERTKVLNFPKNSSNYWYTRQPGEQPRQSGVGGNQFGVNTFFEQPVLEPFGLNTHPTVRRRGRGNDPYLRERGTAELRMVDHAI